MSQLQEQTRQATGNQDFALSNVSDNDFTGNAIVPRSGANENEVAYEGNVTVLRRGLGDEPLNRATAAVNSAGETDIEQAVKSGDVNALQNLEGQGAGVNVNSAEAAYNTQLANEAAERMKPKLLDDDPEEEAENTAHIFGDGDDSGGAGDDPFGRRRHGRHHLKRPRSGKETKEEREKREKRQREAKEARKKAEAERKARGKGEPGDDAPEVKAGKNVLRDAGLDAKTDGALARDAVLARDAEVIGGTVVKAGIGLRLLRIARATVVGALVVSAIAGAVAFLGTLWAGGSMGQARGAAKTWAVGILVPADARAEFSKGNIGAGIDKTVGWSSTIKPFLKWAWDGIQRGVSFAWAHPQEALDNTKKFAGEVGDDAVKLADYVVKDAPKAYTAVSTALNDPRANAAIKKAVKTGLTGEGDFNTDAARALVAASQNPTITKNVTIIAQDNPFGTPAMPRRAAKTEDPDADLPPRPVVAASNGAPVLANGDAGA